MRNTCGFAVLPAVVATLLCSPRADAQIFKPKPPTSSAAQSKDLFAKPLESPIAPTSPQSQPTPFGQAPAGQPLFAQIAPDAPAPYWLKEGVRLTFYSAAASIPATAHYYYPDEKGDWVDDEGKRYSQGDNPGPAGHGITQLNIACIDENMAVVQARSYGYTNVSGPLIPIATIGYTASIGSCDWWISPKTLQQTQPADTPGMKVLRIPWQQNGKTYKAVAFKRDRRDAHSFSIYDEVTGLLLTQNTSSVAPDGRQTLSQIKFMDWRTVRWPWAATNAPAWVAGATGLRYQGDSTVTVPGGPPIPVPLAVTLTFGRKARQWAGYSVQSQLTSSYGPPQVPSTAEMIAGPSIFGGLWVDPAALRNLRQGQTLDQDKIAGTTVQVTQAGGPAVQLTEFGQLHKMACTYDANTGILLQHVLTNDTLHTTQTINLVR